MNERSWTTQELRMLKELLHKGYTNKRISSVLSQECGKPRSEVSVRAAKARFGLRRNQ